MNNAVTTVTAGVPGPSVLAAMADRYSMAPAAFEATLRATVVPKDCTREQFAAFLLVAKQYKLNPLTREIFAFPTRGGGIQPVVSIDGWLNLANSHPQMDGIEFDDQIDGDGEVISVTARIWRKDRAHPIVVTEYMSECARNTEPWKQWPRRMLRHKAAIQAARYAFGFAGFVDPDEAERMGADVSAMRHVTPPPRPPSAPKAPQIEAAADSHDPDTGEMIEDETRAQEPAGAPGAPPAPNHP
jgi:phage recombination protein Bet